jgi:acyl transferase domain-containing protein
MSETTTALTPVKRALLKIDALRRELADTRARLEEPIAIVGIGCRLPGGADSAEGLWQLVATGTDAVTDVPADRWSDALHDPRPGRADTFYCHRGAFIDDVDRFDPAFFGLSGREAHRLDPQQRLLLECTWRAMEDARFTTASLQGSRTGVFVGSSLDDYARLSEAAEDAEPSFAQTELGTARPFAAGRIAYLFGFHGPALHLDTACSSSLVTMHLACQSLRNRECDLAFSGGANLMLSPEMTIALSELQALSPDGRCATFDAAANGYVRGEGAGVVALMRLSDARAQGRPIRAVIRGSAVNHDGRSNGMTAPNGRAQRDVIREALARAGVAPGEVDYVEAHGTGTALGDPIELRALHDVYGRDVERAHDLHVGSIKTNIGHLEGAASVAALIKVVGALQHAELPPHLHFSTPTPHLDWSTQRLRVPTARTPWPSNRPGKRIAAISAFGMSGTNAHLVVEAWDGADTAAISPAPDDDAGEAQVLPVSAHSPAALARALEDLAAFASAEPAPTLADLAHTLRTGRDARRQRATIVASTCEEFVATARSRAAAAASGAPAPAPLAFLFTGQGAQYAGMARRLYQACPVFRRTIDECDAAFEAETGESLVDVLYADDGATARIDETRYTQPALFAIELALARLWSHWGLRPQALIGHSVGEYAAACFAGVFSVADGIRLVAARGRLMQEMTAPGRMSAVLASADRVRLWLAPYAGKVALAGDNAPMSVVVAGEAGAHDDLVAELAGAGLECRPLAVTRAFHSPLMEPMLAAFREVARGITYHAPTIRVVSNVSAAFESQRLCDPEYWVEHVRATVRFREGLQALLDDGAGLLLEVGPAAVLAGLAKAGAAVHERAASVSCVASLDRKRDDRRALLAALATVADAGHEVDWAAVDTAFDAARPARVTLPPYPFDRGSYWVGARRPAAQARPFAIAGGRARERHAPIAALGLLGEELCSPGLADRRFERRLALDAMPMLRGHAFRDRIVFPAAGFAAMALEAARRLAPGPMSLADLSIDTPLALDDAQAVTLASVVQASGDRSRIDIHARVGESRDWTRHAGATLVTADADDEAAPDATLSDAELVDIEAFHDRLAHTGLRYAGPFRALRALERAEGRAIGRIALDKSDAAEPWPVVHPALLDNALQVVAAALWSPAGEADAPAMHLPVGIDRLDVPDAIDASRPLTAHVRIVAREPLVRADVDLRDDEGRRVARLRGVRLAPVDVRRLAGPSTLELRWERRADEPAMPAHAPRALLVSTADDAFADDLLPALGGAEAAALALRVPMGAAGPAASATRRQAWKSRLSAALTGPAARRPEVVVYIWPAPAAIDAADPLVGDAHAVASAHHRFVDFWDALHTLELDGSAPRVAVVTRHG